MSANHVSRNSVAITGIGCRFPGGIINPDSFWNLLVEGKDEISEVDTTDFSGADARLIEERLRGLGYID